MITVSVVVSTYNRADSLRRTLEGLDLLDYGDFEVVVVNGPSTDSTSQLLADYAERIKIATCPNRNLSESRNIGIAAAAGDVVAFIDDDAYPDPAWLDRLVEGYDTEEIAGVGGPVYDHTGTSLQALYSRANRYSDTSVGFEFNPTALLNFPFTESFVYLIGTNASFRRCHLVEVGGFDEEFEYILDEVDLCVRLVDRGFILRALDDGFTYHGLLANELRGANRTLRDRFVGIKNRVYFALKHGVPHGSFFEVSRHLMESTTNEDIAYRRNVDAGLLQESDYQRFRGDIPKAFDLGLERFLSGGDRTRPRTWFEQRQEPFKRYRLQTLPTPRLHLVLLSQEYTPAQTHGIAGVVKTLATGLAGNGHVVHVLTRAEDHDRVDLEDGVWVHRVVVRHSLRPDALHDVPDHQWNYSASVSRELDRIHRHRPVDVVQFPNWDAEGVAVLADGRFRTVVGLHTPIEAVAGASPQMATSPEAPRVLIDRLRASERWVYQRVDAAFASGSSTVEDIAQDCNVNFARSTPGLIDHAHASGSCTDERAPEISRMLDEAEKLYQQLVHQVEASG